ncbi:MAG: hypothetical protein ACREOW_16495 [Thermodesulfobacteriota bacterium]
MEKPEILGIALFPALVISTLIIALSCGANPPFAPQGSTIEITNPPEDITIPANSLAVTRVEAFVTDPEGFALNDVRVFFSLSFAGRNDRVVDTNGDGVSDARALQLVNPDACEEIASDCQDVDQSLWSELGAYVDSPFRTLTDDRGIADVLILTSGPDIAIVDPASFEASLRNGSVDVIQFTVNVP